MQRLRILSLFGFAVYWCLAAFAIHAADTAEPPPPEELDKPHVAALLPLKSAGFGRLAEAVRLGLVAAASNDGTEALPLIFYPVGDDPQELVDTYDLAQRQGARLVLGPLTKSGVQTLATSFATTVPTLVLTLPDSDVLLPDNMFGFGVQIESEARQVARLALSQGRRRAVIILHDTALGRRVAQAFADEWTRTTRLIVDQLTFTTDAAQLKKMKERIAIGNADMVFFALDGLRARQMKPYLGKALPAYGTSQIYGAANDAVGAHDLNGVTFVDMPWVLMPDHPAVIAYPRATGLTTLDQERFYALGIDAWRLGQALLESGYSDIGTMDGVTGYITPGGGHQFTREAIAAQFQQGQPRLLNPVTGR